MFYLVSLSKYNHQIVRFICEFEDLNVRSPEMYSITQYWYKALENAYLVVLKKAVHSWIAYVLYSYLDLNIFYIDELYFGKALRFSAGTLLKKQKHIIEVLLFHYYLKRVKTFMLSWFLLKCCRTKVGLVPIFPTWCCMPCFVCMSYHLFWNENYSGEDINTIQENWKDTYSNRS